MLQAAMGFAWLMASKEELRDMNQDRAGFPTAMVVSISEETREEMCLLSYWATCYFLTADEAQITSECAFSA